MMAFICGIVIGGWGVWAVTALSLKTTMPCAVKYCTEKECGEMDARMKNTINTWIRTCKVKTIEESGK